GSCSRWSGESRRHGSSHPAQALARVPRSERVDRTGCESRWTCQSRWARADQKWCPAEPRDSPGRGRRLRQTGATRRAPRWPGLPSWVHLYKGSHAGTERGASTRDGHVRGEHLVGAFIEGLQIARRKLAHATDAVDGAGKEATRERVDLDV